jgi:DNA-binding transcriptional MerR regulator
MSTQPPRGYLGISEVLAQLRDEFPDISVSKIRFLETEGLLTPARSPSGYRRFCAADVDRLRYILAAQRDLYLPLRVIRERLDRLGAAPAQNVPEDAGAGGTRLAGSGLTDTGRAGTGPAATRRAAGPAPAVTPRPATGRAARASSAEAWLAGSDQPAGEPDRAGQLLSRRELIEAAGLSEALLTELETFGLLRRVGRHYGPDAVQVARTAVALTAYGVEARHLRAVRAAVERETTMIESLVAPITRQRGHGARELAERTAGELADLVLQLHCALVDGALAEAGLAGTGSAPQVAVAARLAAAGQARPGQEAEAGPRRAGRTEPGVEGASA